MAVGTTTINFGAAPGGFDAQVAVTGQGSILATSYVEAFVMAEASADHTDDEHVIAPISLRCGVPTAGVGFTIFATSDIPLSGLWSIRWVWS